MIAPGQKLRTRWRAHRTYKKTIETRAIPRQRVNVRGCQIRITIQAEIPPSLIISQNHNHIRLLRLNPNMSQHQKKKNKSLHAPILARPKEIGKEFLLMIPERPFMPSLILKSNRPNRQCLNMSISKNGTGPARVSVYHSQRLRIPTGTGRHFKHPGILKWVNRSFFNPLIRVSLIRIRH